jgi:hypothetical protein
MAPSIYKPISTLRPHYPAVFENLEAGASIEEMIEQFDVRANK